MSGVQAFRSLVLNSTYEPMRIVSWQKALLLWFQGKVEIIEFHAVVARSARSTFQIPSVLKLKSYVRPRRREVIRFCRENIYIRDNFTCQYCGFRLNSKLLTLDHVIPVSKSGKCAWENVVSACQKCNQKKAARTPSQANMPLIKEPIAPVWLPNKEFELNPNAVPEIWKTYLKFRSG